MRSLLKNNNFLSLAGNVSAAGLGFISFALLARILSTDDFGKLMIFISLCTFFDLLRTGFLHTPLIKFSSVEHEGERKEVIGTAWTFGLLITVIVGSIGLLAYFIAKKQFSNEGFLLFLKLLWLLSAATLPMNFASWNLQSEMKFNKIIFIRWITLGSFILMLLLEKYYLHRGLSFIIYSFIGSNLFASVICLLCKWTNISYLKYSNNQRMKEISNFGKYSMSSMVGSNLLRSSDTFMIGALLNPTAVAIYSIPAKLFELVEIPLRSFVATALPNLSRLVNANDTQGLKHLFERYSGAVTIFLIPVTLFSIVFANQLVLLLGGEQYAESVNILRIFAVFALLMPLDRYSGVMLDVLNLPIKNFQKILVMLFVKVGGNLIVIYTIGEVWAIALSSIATFAVGLVVGVLFLKRSLDFSVVSLLKKGYLEGKLYTIKGFNKISSFRN